MSTTHTPGPWRVAEGRSCWHVVSGDNALHTGCITFDGRGLANAHLIAAAPDLLAACREALDWYGPDGDHIGEPWRTVLLAAIAKAEGK